MQTTIIIDGTTYTTGISSGSLYLERIIVDSELDLGLPIANRFEVQMYGISDVSGQTIQVYQTDDEGENQIDLFYGKIDSAKLDANGYYRDIVAYDAFYYKREVDVHVWWENFWEFTISSTLKELRRSLLEYIGIEEADEEVELPNDEVIITKDAELSVISFGDMLHLICQAQAVFPNIDAYGKIEYIIPTSDITELDNTNYRISESTFEEYTTPEYECVKVYMGETLKYVSDVGIPYVLKDNILIMNLKPEVLKPLCDNIIVTLSNISFNPCDLTMIQTDNTIQLGDKIESQKGTHFAFSIVTKGVQFIEQSISCKGEEEAKDTPASDITYTIFQENIEKTVDQKSIRNYEYRNGNLITIRDQQRRRIVNMRMASTDVTRVDVHIEVNLQTLAITDYTKVGVDYTVDAVVQAHTPEETYIDGNHVLHLMYILPLTANVTINFGVYLTADGGEIIVPRKGVWLYASGLNIVGDGVWDGTFDIDEAAEKIPITALTVANTTESVSVETKIPIPITASDRAVTSQISGMTVSSATEDVVPIRHNTAYERTTEDGDTRIVEVEDGTTETVRYTEEEL